MHGRATHSAHCIPGLRRVDGTIQCEVGADRSTNLSLTIFSDGVCVTICCGALFEARCVQHICWQSSSDVY